MLIYPNQKVAGARVQGDPHVFIDPNKKKFVPLNAHGGVVKMVAESKESSTSLEH